MHHSRVLDYMYCKGTAGIIVDSFVQLTLVPKALAL